MPAPPISPELQLAAIRAQQDLRLRQLLAALRPQLDAEHLDTEIHPDCQMLAHSLAAHQDANRAVSQYFAVAMQQYDVVCRLLDLLFDPAETPKFMDFACGYGRLLRFLVHRLPREQIHAAEIQPDALAWVDQRYGVRTWASAPDPQDFRPDQRFDFIWVASLFSHLPDALFGPWLARLSELLSPQGVLCLSVHDEATLPPGMQVPESGLLYQAGSENPDLSPAIYGTTFVNPDYVQRAIAQHVGEGCRHYRLPRLLAHEQDVYVLTRGQRPLDALARMPRGTRGWLDELEADPQAGRLFLKGWAGSLDEPALAGVALQLAEHEELLATGEPRPQVAEVLGRAELASSGFSTTLPLPSGEPPWLALTTRSLDGHGDLIYAGCL